jgi:ubiquinone/menaquinone biosynthesis C-methylase UbiE
MKKRAGLWSELLGRGMSRRLRKWILPNHQWSQEIYGSVLLESLGPGARWLDAGCGYRILAGGLEELESALVSKAGLAVGADLSTEGLHQHQLLRQRVCATLENIPFPDESFDVISCNMVLEHIPQPAAVFGEFARLLRPNGLLVIHTPNVVNYTIFLSHCMKKVLPQSWISTLAHWSDARAESDVFPTYYRANSRAKLRRLAGKSKLAEEKFETLPGPQPLITFFAPIALAELLLMRATKRGPLRRFAPVILGVYRKPQPTASTKPMFPAPSERFQEGKEALPTVSGARHTVPVEN